MRARIRFNLIHFSLPRLIFSIMCDIVWLFVSDKLFRKSILKAYRWNLTNIGNPIKRRIKDGPCSFKYKHPLIPFIFSRKKE